MAKGLQSWTVKESGAPVSSAQVLRGSFTGGTTYSFSKTTRAILGVTAQSHASTTLTLTLAGGGTILIPNAAINSVFAPGSITPFACDSFVFSVTEPDFSIIGLF